MLWNALVFNLYGNEDMYVESYCYNSLLSDLSSCDFIPDEDDERFYVLWSIMMTGVGGLFFSGSHYRLCVHINLEKWLMDSPTPRDVRNDDDHYL